MSSSVGTQACPEPPAGRETSRYRWALNSDSCLSGGLTIAIVVWDGWYYVMIPKNRHQGPEARTWLPFSNFFGSWLD